LDVKNTLNRFEANFPKAKLELPPFFEADRLAPPNPFSPYRVGPRRAALEWNSPFHKKGSPEILRFQGFFVVAAALFY